MHRNLPYILLLITTAAMPAIAQPPQKAKGGLSGEPGQETHLKEAGSAVVLARSAFAHGYRHGYEEGYHLGNIDINMGRLARKKRDQFRGVSQGYSSQFGSKKSFESGFEAGLPAGYSDGFMGRRFRGVEATRMMARALERALPTDSSGLYFDQGLASGYGEGFQKGTAAPELAIPVEASVVNCPQPRSPSFPDAAAENSYCEGYR